MSFRKTMGFRRAALVAACALASSVLTAGAACSEELPLRLVRNHPFLEVTINGHPAKALLDTGAAVSWVDDDLAAEVGIGALWLLSTEDASGPQVRNDRTVPAVIGIGKAVSEERTLGLIDIDAIFAELPEGETPPQAIIGLDILSNYVVELDFDRAVVGLTPKDSYARFPSRGAISFEHVSGLAMLRTRLDGMDARTVIDTGATSAIHMSNAFEGAAYAASLPGSQMMVSSVAGVHQGPIASLGRVEFAGRQFKSVPVTVSSQPIGENIDAVIGMQVLGQFNLILDLSRSRMWMTPNQNFGKPFRRDRIGLHSLGDALGEAGGELVLVAPGSPAEAAGFKPGEIVKEMYDEVGARIESGRDVAIGQKVVIVMGDGSLRTLTGAEYY